MTDDIKPKAKGFSAFRSAAEEARMKRLEHPGHDEGGHMSCTSGKIVQVMGTHNRFKAVMSQARGGAIEFEFATMREAEAFVRRNTPRPDERSTLYDRDAEPSS
jgi:hypothetical protein